MNRIKDFLQNTFGTFGTIIWFAIIILFDIAPLIMLGLPTWAVIVILLALELIPILGFAGDLISSLATEILWVWALVVTILGTQNTLAIIFYILFLINLIRYSFTFVFSCSAQKLNAKFTALLLTLILGVLLVIIGISLYVAHS